MMKCLTRSFLFTACLLGSTLAYAESYTPVDDTYVQYDESGPHGAVQDLYVKNAYLQDYTRKAYIEFDVPEYQEVVSARLELSVSKFKAGEPPSTFNVWGFSDKGIFAKHSGLAMDVSGISQENGALVHQWSWWGGQNQDIYLEPTGDGYYYLKAKHSGKCLDIENQSTANAARLHQWDCWGGQNQQFQLVDAGDGYYFIKARHSGKCLSLDYGSANEGAIVIQWDCHGGDDQKWQINSLCEDTDLSEDSLVSTSTLPNHPLPFQVMGEWNEEYGNTCSFGGQQSGPLATFTLDSADLNQTISIDSTALDQYVKLNGAKAGFIITRENCCDGNDPAFASKEHPTLEGPRLVVSGVGEAVFANWAGNATDNGDGSWHFTGDMEIPYTGGGLMLCSGIEADITFDANGNISTFNGTMTTPSISFQDSNADDMFSQLGDIGDTVDANSLVFEVGYDYPEGFDTGDLPMDPSKKYFYFVQKSPGVSAGWGGTEFSAGGNTSLFAFDPNTPALWAYTDAIGNYTKYVNNIGFGISNAHNILFTPLTESYVESYINEFYGNTYIATSVNIPTPIPALNLTVDGNVTIDTDGELLALEDDHAFRQMGTNGTLALTASLGIFNIELIDLGYATAVVNQQDDPYVAFSATVTPNNYTFLPSFFDVTGTVSGYFDENTGSIKIRGDGSFAGMFSGLGFDLYIDIQDRELFLPDGLVSGTANFGGFQLGVWGSITSSHANLKGSMDYTFDIGSGTSVELSTDVRFDTSQGTISFSSSAKVHHPAGTESVGGGDISVSVDSYTKELQICVDIPNWIPGPDHPCFDF